MGSGLEITIISVLGGIIVALAILGGTGFFWLAGRVYRLTESNAEAHNALSGRIEQSHRELSEKIDERHRDLCERMDRMREDLMRQMEQMRGEIIGALVSHTHPEPGGAPVFSVPAPVGQGEPPAQNGRSDPSAAQPDPAPADD